MSRHVPSFSLRWATGADDIAAAQRLRHQVFVEDCGVRGGSLSQPALGIEADRFDPYCEHLLLCDPLRGNEIIATTRVMTLDAARKAGGFVSEAEFDLSLLHGSNLSLLEIGRTCLHRDYRGGAAMHRLWTGLAAFVAERRIELLFGLASLPGTDPDTLTQTLSCLHHDHLAPAPLRPQSRRPVIMDRLPPDLIDRRAAMLTTPALVKAYLRLGGKIGSGAFLDPDFGCLDVCLVLDTTTLSQRARAIYAPGGS